MTQACNVSAFWLGEGHYARNVVRRIKFVTIIGLSPQDFVVFEVLHTKMTIFEVA